MEKQTTLIILLNKYVSQQYITLSPHTSMNVFSYGRVDQLPSEEEEDEINLLITLKFQHMGG